MYAEHSDSEAAELSKKQDEYHRKHPVLKLGLLKHLPDYNEEFDHQHRPKSAVQNPPKRKASHSASLNGMTLYYKQKYMGQVKIFVCISRQ